MGATVALRFRSAELGAVGRSGFMIHNRYLPGWFHRIVNASAVAAFWCAAGIGLWSAAPLESVWFSIARWCAYATPAVFVGSLFLRLSFIRGIAGGDGYDEFT